jgi:hypothetical protein
MSYKPVTPKRPRAFHTLDKSRSIGFVCQAIREGIVRFFKWDDTAGSPGLVRDFLALREEVMERATGSHLFQIQRVAGLPDDFAQAVVYGCMALWYPDNFPKIGEIHNYDDLLAPEDIQDDDDIKDLSAWEYKPGDAQIIDELE